MRKPLIRNPQHALCLGLVLTITGAYLLYDAHEARGRSRPFLLRFVPGG